MIPVRSFGRAAVALSLAVSFFLHPAASRGAASRDILWDVVSSCIDTRSEDYCSRCRAPRREIDCHDCRNTTDVWQETSEFVALRDRKMCDCPQGFVHGLAVPRTRVSGVEDPSRPDGIWEFAWKAARGRIPEAEIALAVNPKRLRSQDQLHIHLVKVIREKLPRDKGTTERVDSLAKVWLTAARMAADLQWKDYGVLVTRNEDGGFLVVVDRESPEKRFTRYSCR